MKRVIITGPTGQVGMALIDELIKNDVEITAVVRAGSDRVKRLTNSDKLTIIENNLDEMCRLPGLVNGDYDAFYHLAWDFSRDHENVDRQYKNIGYTLEAIRVAHEIGCKVFIGAGSQAEYGIVDGTITPVTPCNPVMAYGMAKLTCGQLGRKLASQLGIKFIWPRIISTYGPGDAESAMIPSLIRSLLKGEKPALTKGEQQWDFMFSRDCAKALRLIAEKGVDGAVYCIGNGSPRPLRDYIEDIRDAINPNLPLGFGEVPYRENQVMKLDIDITSLIEDTGYHPDYSFEVGIRETIEWFRNNGQAFKQEELDNSLS